MHRRLWYLSHLRAAKPPTSLRIREALPEHLLLAHTKNGIEEGLDQC